MQQKGAREILDRYNAGIATEEEKLWVEGWYAQIKEDDLHIAEESVIAAREEVFKKLPIHAEKPAIKLWPKIVAAASVLLVLSFGAVLLMHKAVKQQSAQQQNDIAPAANQATLTLSNGQKIALTKSSAGKLAQQGLTSIAVTADSALTYSNISHKKDIKVQYNTLSTVRGQQAPFSLKLADGTKVWLNAASSITYPVAFDGNERKVTITGEAYFEVVHNAARPFRVNYKNQTIEDLGTHFNINAYDDEPLVKATLFEGSIRISKGDQKIILKPGQQAASTANAGTMNVKDIDTEEAIAWKNGYFLFDHESLESVMRKISRWYNVDIEYPADEQIIANYWGSMPRESNISVVLNRLEVTNDVKFEVEGNKILVSKK